MDYTVGQDVFISISATYHGMRVKSSFQILKGTFISKSNGQVCAKIELDSSILKETMICVPESDVAPNFKEILDKVYTNRAANVAVQIPSDNG